LFEKRVNNFNSLASKLREEFEGKDIQVDDIFSQLIPHKCSGAWQKSAIVKFLNFSTRSRRIIWCSIDPGNVYA